MKTVFIYGLIDPRTDEIRYVGKSEKALTIRLKDHRSESRTSPKSNHRLNWLRLLNSLELIPTITLLEEVPYDDWQWYETWWIVYGGIIGWKLTNSNKGGMGGISPTTELSKILSESQKGNKKMFGKHHSEETRRKQSEIKKGQNHPNWGIPRTDSTKIKIGLPQRGEGNHNARNTSEQVLEMRWLYDNGGKIPHIAKWFNEPSSNVWQIVKRRRWKHLP